MDITVIGSGSVDINPEELKYASGTVVQLTAIPDQSWTFTGWSGDLDGSINPIFIVMDSNKTITAHFIQNESEIPWAFVIVSDVHTSTNPSGTQLNFGQVKEWIDDPTLEMPAPEFMVITGDFPPVSEAINPSETDDIINTVFGPDFMWFPVIGNHEISDGIGNFNWCRDTKFPTLPWIINSGPTGSINTTYSWDYANAHFIAVNGYWDGTTNSGGDHARDGDVVPALRSWIDSDLSATSKIHKFAFIHEPAYPDYRHVGDSLDKYPANRDAFVTMLDNHSVETLFCGHTHYYEHDISSEYPLLGNVHQLTNAKFRAETGDGGHTITYVLINGTKATYKIYYAPSTTTGYPFTFLEEWTIDMTPVSYSLSVTTEGNGTVTSNPNQTIYSEGTLVNLTATPDSGWIFSCWSGDLTGYENPVIIAMDADKTIIATFIDQSLQNIAISYPNQYVVFQRHNGTTGEILVTGSYEGSPTAIEASFNSGPWVLLDDDPEAGLFSGSFNASVGQGVLQVRFANAHSITDSVSDVGIGDVFVIAGQSNAVGHGNTLNTLDPANPFHSNRVS